MHANTLTGIMAKTLKNAFIIMISLAAISFSSVTAPLPACGQRSLAITLYESGVKSYNKGNYRESLRMFRQCVEILRMTPHTSVEEKNVLYSLGETLRCLGQYREAEATLKQALQITDRLPPFQRDYFFIFNGMALLYQAQGRFTEAEALWKQCEPLANKNNPNLLYPVGNLARLYFVWGKLEEEGEYVEKGERLAKIAPKTLAMPYWKFNLAQYLEQQGQYQEADEKYQDALDSCSRLVGANHAYCGLILTNQAELYRKQSRYKKAEECLQQALRIFQSAYASEHPDICETMVRIAKVESEEGKYSQARELASAALKIEENIFGAGDNLFIARAKNCLGNIARQEGRYKDAQELLDQSLGQEQRLLGSDNVEVAVTMRDLALVHEDLGDYEKAESILSSSLAIIEQQTGAEHPERAAAASALAHAYSRDEKYDQAEPLLKKALALSEKVLGADHVLTASGARDLGELYLKQKRYAEAQTFLQKSLAIDEKLYGDKAPQVAADLTSLATACGAQGKSENAEPLLKRAAEIKNILPGGNAVLEVPRAVASTGADRPVTGKWALVIGISNFKDSSINLKFASKDATDFKNFLINTEKFRSDHVKLLTDDQATRENIIGMLGEKWLAGHVKPDDLVVLYISSHGSSSTAEAGGANFLVAYDTNKNSLLATGIPMQWLTNIVSEQVKSDRVVMILDVCHSGSVLEGQKSLSRAAGLDPRAMKIGRGQMVICSSLANQISWESKNYENSVFTRRLIEALQCEKDKTTIFDAYRRLKVLVESEVLRDRGDLQTPVLDNKHWLGTDPALAIEPATASH